MPQFTSHRANVLASSEAVAPQRSYVPASLSGRTRIRIPTMQAVDGGSTITMPALSSTMTEGKISQWLKGIGDKIEAGDMVLVVESDKADMDVEAYEEGYLAAILTDEGETAAVGAPVAALAVNEADIEKVAAAAKGGAVGGA